MSLNEKIQKFKVCDIALIKLGVFAFALMVAKLWSEILSLDWYWYLVIWAIAAIKPMITMFKGEESTEQQPVEEEVAK